MFVKRIPLTELESDRSFSTRNHFRMPAFYNYGVGSAGFGAWRELVAHIKTTGWVLEGVCENFPLLLHWRVLRRTDRGGQPSGATSADYLKRWNNSKAIGAYMHARDVAPYEIWLVLEHVPHVLARWLPAHPERTGDVVAQVLDTITFLRRNDIVHFDAHFGNIVTDGSTAFLTDYGLVNDGRFDLTETERTFLRRHSHYDYGAFLAQFSPWWVLRVQKMSPEQHAELNEVCSIEPGMPYPEILGRVIDHLDEVMNRQLVPVHPALAEMLQRHRDLIVYMFDFYGQLSSNPRKDTPFDDDLVRRDLTAAGVSL